MRKRLLIPLIILAVGIAAVVLLRALSPQPHPMPPIEEPSLAVPVVLAVPQTQQITVSSQGNLQPKRAIDLVAQVGGQIVEVAENFADGAIINKGDKLLQVDDRDYRYALARAEAQVAQAAEALAMEKGRARQARREWRDLGDEEANALFLRKPQIAAAEANLTAAKAERDQAELNLERASIEAPFNGRIEETAVNLGQYITAGTPVASIYDASVAEVQLPLTSQQAGLLRLPTNTTGELEEGGTPVTLHGDLLGRRVTWTGKLVRVQARIDTDSRFQYVVAEVAAGEGQPPLAMGTFVEAEILSRPLPNVIELPASALVKRQSVYTVNDQNQVEIHPVELIRATVTSVWVRGDIPAGTPVMVDKQQLVSAGADVVPELQTRSLTLPGVPAL